MNGSADYTVSPTLAGFQNKRESKFVHDRTGVQVVMVLFGISPEKIQCMEFGCFSRQNARIRGQKPKEFTFVEFSHYRGKTGRTASM